MSTVEEQAVEQYRLDLVKRIRALDGFVDEDRVVHVDAVSLGAVLAIVDPQPEEICLQCGTDVTGRSICVIVVSATGPQVTDQVVCVAHGIQGRNILDPKTYNSLVAALGGSDPEPESHCGPTCKTSGCQGWFGCKGWLA